MFIKLIDNTLYLDLCEIKPNITLEDFYTQIGDIINMKVDKFDIIYEEIKLSECDIKKFIDSDEIIINEYSPEEYLNSKGICIRENMISRKLNYPDIIHCMIHCGLELDNNSYLNTCMQYDYVDTIFVIIKYYDYTRNINYRKVLEYACNMDNRNLVELIINKDKDISIYEYIKSMSLHIMIARNKLNIVKFMIENGCDITELMNNKNILYYVYSGVFNPETNSYLIYRNNINIDMLEYLIQFIDIIPNDKITGKTCLHDICTCFSRMKNVEQCIMLLLDYVDINAQDNNGNTALHNAIKHDRVDIFKILYNNNADMTIKNKIKLDPIQYGAVNNSIKIFKFINTTSIIININTDVGRTLLHNTRIRIDILEQILINGADPNTLSMDDIPPLLVHRNDNKFKLLIKYGADVNLKDKYDRSILYNCIHPKKITLIKILVDNGAYIHQLTYNGKCMISILRRSYDYKHSTKLILYLNKIGVRFI